MARLVSAFEDVPPVVEQDPKPASIVVSYVYLMTSSLADLPPLGPQDLRLERIDEIQDAGTSLSPPTEVPPTRAAYK